jgi:drug/metabolite transporter (DMT)-like permease
LTPVAGAVPGVVVGAVLFAALLHASWNALIKARSDPFLATVMLAAGAGLVGALVLPFVAAPLAPSWPFIAGSSLIHVLYCALLVEAYRNADMSHAYPLIRGSAPLLVALAAPLVGDRLSASQWAAVGLICAGSLALYASARGQMKGARRTTVFALLTACATACYTLVDGAGVRRSGAPVGYTMWVIGLTGAGVLALGLWQRPRDVLRYGRDNAPLSVLGGAISLSSYAIALWAMTLAPVPVVAALRETSILFATAIAALFLREQIRPARLAAVLLVACGAALMRVA